MIWVYAYAYTTLIYPHLSNILSSAARERDSGTFVKAQAKAYVGIHPHAGFFLCTKFKRIAIIYNIISYTHFSHIHIYLCICVYILAPSPFRTEAMSGAVREHSYGTKCTVTLERYM